MGRFEQGFALGMDIFEVVVEDVEFSEVVQEFRRGGQKTDATVLWFLYVNKRVVQDV